MNHKGRVWLVSEHGAHEVQTLTGQSDTGEALGILGLVGGLFILGVLIEALPGALIAHYGFNAAWGKSIAIGIGSAIGLNMIMGALRPGPVGATQQQATQPVYTLPPSPYPPTAG